MHKIFIPSPKAAKFQVGKLRSVSLGCHFVLCSWEVTSELCAIRQAELLGSLVGRASAHSQYVAGSSPARGIFLAVLGELHCVLQYQRVGRLSM